MIHNQGTLYSTVFIKGQMKFSWVAQTSNLSYSGGCIKRSAWAMEQVQGQSEHLSQTLF